MKAKKIALLINLDNKGSDLLSQIYEHLVSTGERYITTQLMLDCLKEGLSKQGYSWDAFPPAVVMWVERGVKSGAKLVMKKVDTWGSNQGQLIPYPTTLTVRNPDNGDWAHTPIGDATTDDFLEHWAIMEEKIEDSEKKLQLEKETLMPVLKYMDKHSVAFYVAMSGVYGDASTTT